MIIQSVHRALAILELFSVAQPCLGITEIARALGIHKNTAQCLVRTLARDGFLEQDPGTRKYRLGLKIYEMGVVMAGCLEINRKSVDPAHRLTLKTHLIVRVSVPCHDTAITTLDVYPRTQPFLVRQFGIRFPLYCTAMGKALLAFRSPTEIEEYLAQLDFFAYTPNTITRKDDLLAELDEIRKRGYSVNREEHIQARAAIGAPIFGSTGRVVASAALVGEPGRILGGQTESLARTVMSMASETSQAMGYVPDFLKRIGECAVMG